MKRITISGNPRNGSKDVWNAFMVQNAEFTENDLPISYGTKIIPKKLVSYDVAKNLFKRKLRNEPDFHENSFIHFYLDDCKFDSKRENIWTFPEKVLDIIGHFDGIITPDFSTNIDFPIYVKQYNTYRMRSYGAYMSDQGIPFIHNVRWGYEDSWNYCFNGIPVGETVAIGTVASGIRELVNRDLFDNGFRRMIEVIKPPIIIVYGSSKYAVFREAEKQGIRIITFPSKTSLSFKGGIKNE